MGTVPSTFYLLYWEMIVRQTTNFRNCILHIRETIALAHGEILNAACLVVINNVQSWHWVGRKGILMMFELIWIDIDIESGPCPAFSMTCVLIQASLGAAEMWILKNRDPKMQLPRKMVL